MAPPEVPPASALDASDPDEGGRDQDKEENETPVSGAGAGLPPLPPPPLAEDPKDDEEVGPHVFGNGGVGFDAEEGGPGALAVDVGDQDPEEDEEVRPHVFGNGGLGFDAEEREHEALAVDDADASTDGDDEVEAGANGGLGFDEDDAADSPTDVDSQEGDEDDEAGALAVDTEPVIRAVAVGGLLAVVLGLGGALLLGVATTTTEPRHQAYEYNVDDTRQPPLLCGDHGSRACHPWGATSTASPRPPLVVTVPERLPLSLSWTTTAPSTTAPITETDDHPRVVSGAADWAQQHQRGGTSSAVPLPTTAGGSEERRGAAARRFVLYCCVFLVVAMVVAAFETMLH